MAGICTGLLLCRIAGAKPLNVVTTTSDLASIAREVGGEKVTVCSLVDGTQDPHFAEPRPSMVMKVKNADLLVAVGLELDLWVYSLMDAARNANVGVGKNGYLDASTGIRKLDALPAGAKVDGSMGDVHPQGNPHYWLDPENGKVIAREIAERLVLLSPADAAYFRQNCSGFEKKIDALLVRLRNALAADGVNRIVTYHRSWPYFAKQFGIAAVTELEPKPGISPSPAHLAEVIGKVKRDKAQVVLIEVFYNRKAADFVSRETRVPVAVVPNSVGGTREARDYISLFDDILTKMENAIKKP